MDAHPWSYQLAAAEMRREGKIDVNAAAGSGKIPDPRRYVVIEACGEVGNAALAFAVGVRGEPKYGVIRLQWISSDRGLRQFRIVRDGCFRAAIPLPPGAQMADIHAVRAIAYDRPPAEGKPPAPTTPVRLTRINKMFILDGEYLPSRSRFAWQGSATLAPAGPPLDMPVP